MKGNKTRWVGRLALCAMLLATGTPGTKAQAQEQGSPEQLKAPPDLPEPTPEQREEASTRFARGVELFRQGAFRSALVELKRAYELVPDYRILFNIGQTHAQISQHVEAIAAFESFLSYSGDQLSQERRASIEQILAGLRKHVAELAVTVDEPGADIYFDGERKGRSPLIAPLRVGIGRHRVEARHPDGRFATQDVNLFGGDHMEITLRLAGAKPVVVGGGGAPAAEPVAGQQPAAKPAAQDNTSEDDSGVRRKVGIGLLIGGGVAALSAVTFAVLASSARDDLDKALDKPNSGKKIDDARDSMETSAALTDVSLGLALMAGSVGATLLLFDGRSDRDGSKDHGFQLSFSPNGIRARGRF